MRNIIGKRIGKYTIIAEIGQGGMAAVYLAEDPVFRRQVALKVLPPQFLENELLRARFEREARAIAAIEHPAIVPVYDYGEQDGQLYLVMRHMPGGSLSARLRRGALPLAAAVDLLSRLVPALDAVHARAIVHRDLKPGNILYDAYENPALADFGIAQISQATVELTGTAVVGTPAYMSPEQVEGREDIDGRSDLYALGIVFFEMLTGRQPYRAATPMAVALKHLIDPVPQLRLAHPGFPDELDAVLAKLLAKQANDRYASGALLVADLRALPDRVLPAPGATLVDQPSSTPAEFPQESTPPGLPTAPETPPVPAKPLAALPADRDPQPATTPDLPADTPADSAFTPASAGLHRRPSVIPPPAPGPGDRKEFDQAGIHPAVKPDVHDHPAPPVERAVVQPHAAVPPPAASPPPDLALDAPPTRPPVEPTVRVPEPAVLPPAAVPASARRPARLILVAAGIGVLLLVICLLLLGLYVSLAGRAPLPQAGPALAPGGWVCGAFWPTI